MARTANTATQAIIEAASEWLVHLHDERVSVHDREEFVRWLQASPVHVREYLMAEVVWEDFAHLDYDRLPDVDALSRETRENIVPLLHAS